MSWKGMGVMHLVGGVETHMPILYQTSNCTEIHDTYITL